MRRTPAEIALSARIRNNPISPVARVCVPPQSSIENGLLASAPPRLVPMETTRTSSPYFSPNSARAPEALASSMPISRVDTASFCRITALAMSSTRDFDRSKCRASIRTPSAGISLFSDARSWA